MAHFTLGVYALGRSEATHSSTTSTLRQLKIWGQVSEKRKYASLDGPPIPPGPWPSSLKRCFYRDSACSPLQPANPVPQEPHGQIWTWDSRSPSREFRWRIHKNQQKPWEIHKLMKFQGLRATWHALSLRINVNPHDEVGILHARPQRLNSHRYTHKFMLLSIRPSIHQSINPSGYLYHPISTYRPI